MSGGRWLTEGGKTPFPPHKHSLILQPGTGVYIRKYLHVDICKVPRKYRRGTCTFRKCKITQRIPVIGVCSNFRKGNLKENFNIPGALPCSAPSDLCNTKAALINASQIILLGLEYLFWKGRFNTKPCYSVSGVEQDEWWKISRSWKGSSGIQCCLWENNQPLSSPAISRILDLFFWGPRTTSPCSQELPSSRSTGLDLNPIPQLSRKVMHSFQDLQPGTNIPHKFLRDPVLSETE